MEVRKLTTISLFLAMIGITFAFSCQDTTTTGTNSVSTTTITTTVTGMTTTSYCATLLINNFEGSSESMMAETGWGEDAFGSGTLSSSTDTASLGSSSLKVVPQFPFGGANRKVVISKNVTPMDMSGYAEFVAYVQMDTASNYEAQIWVQSTAGYTHVASATSFPTGSSGFKRLAISTSSLTDPADVRKYGIQIYSSTVGTATIYIDQFQLEGCVNPVSTIYSTTTTNTATIPVATTINYNWSTQSTSTTIVYNGESVTYAAGASWDGNGSTIGSSNYQSYSAPNHIQANMNVVNYWSQVAYAPMNYTNMDWSGYDTLEFYVRASQQCNLYISLNDGVASSTVQATAPAFPYWSKAVFNLSTLAGGIDISQVEVIAIGVSGVETANIQLHIDDIILRKGGALIGDRINADDPNIQYFGRWDMTDPTSPRTSWNDTYVKANFDGTSIAVRLQDGNSNYEYIIDDGTPQTLVSTGLEDHILADNLSDSTHSLVLCKRTEPTYGIAIFKGFVLSTGKTLVAPTPPYSRKIEFIGDSITAAAVSEGLPFSRFTQNGYMAYGPQTARLLDAEWHVEAISGIGIYHNYGDTEPPTQLTMTDYFPRTIQQETTAWNFSSWVPDVVVVALGTNDYSIAINTTNFMTNYTSFLTLLRTNYPAAKIFVVTPWAGGTQMNNCRADLLTVVTAFADANVFYINPVDGNGDTTTSVPWLIAGDYTDGTHPTVPGHTKIANKLSQEIAAKLGW